MRTVGRGPAVDVEGFPYHQWKAGRKENTKALAASEHWRDEKINGVIYDMSPSPDFKYHPDVNDDYVCPDVMIICDRKYLKGGSYSGIPRFIVETLSHSTAKRDRTVKMEIYEKAGVEEYWIVSPQGSVEIYYLEGGKYVLEQHYMLEGDREEEAYNAETEIALRGFPHIKITLGEIFEGVE